MKNSLTTAAEIIWQKGALQFGEFELKINKINKNLPLSPFYLNLRTKNNPKPGPLSSQDMEIIAHCLWDKIKFLAQPFSLIAGIPNAGNHLVAALQKIIPQPRGFGFLPLVKTKNGFIVDPKTKFLPGQTVLLIDDVITGATTKFQAIKTIEKTKLKVKNIFVFVDRLQGGKKELEQKGYKVYACCSIYELLTYYWIKEYLNNETYLKCKNYLKNFNK